MAQVAAELPDLLASSLLVISGFTWVLSAYSLAAVVSRAWGWCRHRSELSRGLLPWWVTAASLLVFMVILFGPSLELSARQSSAARWLRCRDTRGPVRIASDEKWTVTYSWKGGFGDGDVAATVASDGETRMDVQRGGEERQLRVVRLPADAVAKLAQTINDTGLLCETPTPRDHYVFDIGKSSVRVRQGAYDKEVYTDECHTLADPAALDAVVQVLTDQEKVLGPEIAWGPYGAAGSNQPCH